MQTGAGNVVVTNGTQQAVDLVARVLLEPGDPVAVETPGYGQPRRLLRSLGAELAALPVDAEGLVVEATPPDARLVAVSPSHQFPLGMAMSLRRRMALLAWAERHQLVVGILADRFTDRLKLVPPTARIEEGLRRLRRCFDA